MNPEQQRIAIAEACGWEPIPEGYYHPDNPIGQTMPDYLNDLNAMHEAEKVLDRDITDPNCLRYRYAHFLYFACADTQQPMRATASQRAEAFLRTIGKWEEAK